MDKSGRLDLESNEVNGTTNKEPVVQATYKKLPEEDKNWESKNDREQEEKPPEPTMIKQNGTDPEVEDEAQERMLQDDVKLTPKKDTTEVKFISENGDAKIDIGKVKQVVSGMGKEELMKFANDPFWIRLRWFLFILFWLLWAAMLVGAILIIVMAPKCNSPAPRKWWQESPIVQLDEFDTPSHDLKGLETLLDTIKAQGINIISLASIVERSKDGHPINFSSINPSLGTIEDLKSFIAAAKLRNQHVILELDPNHSSIEHEWFKDSVARKGNRTSYYVWVDPEMKNGVRTPPNNWLSVYGISAWEWNEQRGQYYLHQFNKTQPDLNFNNPEVVAEFGEILSHWLDLGIEGFRLENTQFLTEDPQLKKKEDLVDIPGSFDSLNHVKTRNRVENGAILRQWRNIVLNKTNNDGLFILRDDIEADLLQLFNDKKSEEVLIDLPQHSQFLITADAGISAVSLNNNISQTLKIYEWPAWDINGKSRPLRSRMSSEIADSLTLMTLLLPGTPIFKYSDITSAKAAFAAVSEKRKGPVFLFGETKTYQFNGTDIFGYTRMKSGNPGYLVVYNSGRKLATVDFSSIPFMAEEIGIFARSPNSIVEGIDNSTTKFTSTSVPVAPKSTLVMSFVPKTD